MNDTNADVGLHTSTL